MTYYKLDKFIAKVGLSSHGCWTWTASTKGDGYAQFVVDGRSRLGHRLAYEHFIGPVPPGLDLDHLCRNRLCVNPTHLEPVTRRENLRRGDGPAKRRQMHAANRRECCIRGHELHGDNLRLYMDKRSGCEVRMCRACERDRSRARSTA